MPTSTTVFPLVILLLFCGPAFGQATLSGVENSLSIHFTTSNIAGPAEKSYTFNDENNGLFNAISFQPGGTLGISYFRTKETGNYYRLGVIGLNISESRRFHTIRNYAYLQDIDDARQTFSRISTQFEIGKFIRRDKLSLGAGVFVRPTYFFLKSTGPSTLDFDARIHETSVYLGVNPIVEFALGKNLRITGQLPLSFGEMAYEVIRYDNAFFTEQDRKMAEFSTKFDFAIAAQLGLTVGF